MAQVTLKKHKLFVYGTLKQGFYNCKHWFATGAKRLKADEVLPGHILISLGHYPAMLKVEGGITDAFAVKGEVWEVDDSVFLEVKAMEEGAGYSTVEVQTESGVKCKAFTMQTITPGTYNWDYIANSKTRADVFVTDRDYIPF